MTDELETSQRGRERTRGEFRGVSVHWELVMRAVRRYRCGAAFVAGVREGEAFFFCGFHVFEREEMGCTLQNQHTNTHTHKRLLVPHAVNVWTYFRLSDGSVNVLRRAHISVLKTCESLLYWRGN